MKGQGIAHSVAESLVDMQAVLDRVSREALKECPPDHPLAPELESCVREAVSGLGECRIRLYAPVLALRRVRCCLQADTCACGEC